MSYGHKDKAIEGGRQLRVDEGDMRLLSGGAARATRHVGLLGHLDVLQGGWPRLVGRPRGRKDGALGLALLNRAWALSVGSPADKPETVKRRPDECLLLPNLLSHLAANRHRLDDKGVLVACDPRAVELATERLPLLVRDVVGEPKEVGLGRTKPEDGAEGVEQAKMTRVRRQEKAIKQDDRPRLPWLAGKW